MYWLIVNADDYGLTVGTNRAICDAVIHGIVTSTSLLANGEAFDNAVTSIQDMADAPGIGVHLTLTEMHPLTAGLNQFIDSAGYLPLSNQPFIQALRLDSHGGKVRSAVRAEWAAQIEKVIRAGIMPTHVDGHKYIHLLPGLAAIAADLAKMYRIPVLRLPRRLIDWRRQPKRLPGLMIVWLMAQAARIPVDRAGLRYADRVGGFAATGKLDQAALTGMLGNLQNGSRAGFTEILCHPAYPTDALRAMSGRGMRWIDSYQFSRETAAMQSAELRAALVHDGWRFTSFAQLA